MFEREITEAMLEGSGEPQEADRIGAHLVVKAFDGAKISAQDLEGQHFLWRALIRSIQEFPVNPFGSASAVRQREQHFRSILQRSVLWDSKDKREVFYEAASEYGWPLQRDGHQRVSTVIKYAIEYVLHNEGPGALRRLPECDPLKGGLQHARGYFRDAFDAHPDWFVESVLARNGPTVVGGPLKCLKTHILLDLMISLASSTPFLGRWNVPCPVRVAVIAGEDTDWQLRHRVRSICKAKGLPGPELPMFLGAMGTLPNLNTPETVEELCRMICDEGVGVIAIDPLYLALGPSEDGAANPNSLYSMGRALAGFSNAIQAVGCTPIICHHFTMQSSRGINKLPELTDLAHSGVAQFARQWILVNRRGRYDPNSAVHRLRLSLGGYTHGETSDVDVSMEPRPDGLWGWEPRFAAQASEASDPSTDGKRNSRKPASKAKDQSVVLKAIHEHAGPAVARKLRDSTGLSDPKIKQALAGLLERGEIRKVPVTRTWRNQTRSFDGYEPTAPSSSRPPTG